MAGGMDRQTLEAKGTKRVRSALCYDHIRIPSAEVELPLRGRVAEKGIR